METTTDLLFAASGRNIQALDRFTGRIVWRMKLPRYFGGNIVTVLACGEELFIGRGGYVYCLDRTTGSVLWERGVGSSGASLVTLATDGSGNNQASAIQAVVAAQAAAAAASSAAAASAAG